MLFKNDEPYTLTAADHKSIAEKFKKYPIRLIYPESRVKKSTSPHNRLPDKPNSISFPLTAVRRTKNGSENWRYAEHKIVGEKGQITWTPTKFMLRGSHDLYESDRELIWWLINCCPVLEGGENQDKEKEACCVIEDLRTKAELIAEKEEENATVKALIFSSKVGLGEDKLRSIAKAYFIQDVDDMTFAQVKIALEKVVMRDKENGIKNFLEITNSEQVLNIKANIQTAIDKGIIKFSIKKRSWEWVSESGRKNEPIAQVSPTVDENEALYNYFLGNQKFAQMLSSSLKGDKIFSAKEEEDEE